MLIAAPLFAKLGSQLWPKESVSKNTKKTHQSLAPKVDFGKYMKEWRFKQLKLLLPKTMEDDTKKEVDDWWRMRKMMDKYTETTKNAVYVSSLIVLDETMSALVPRTTKTGNLPNLSFVKRKPEPLGTEFKVAMDGLVGKTVSMEIQEGKFIISFCNISFI